MAVKKARFVRVRARVSFNEVQQGDEAVVEMNDRMGALLAGGFMEVVGGGEDPVGPGGAEPDDAGRLPA